jgi:ABC-2 type transport system permease protein
MRLDPRRVGTIARREFLTTVRRKGFILTLILMPAYGVFATAMGMLPTMLAKRSTETRVVAVVDPAGVLGAAPGEVLPMSPEEAGDSPYTARFYGTLDDALAAFRDGRVRTVLRLDADYLASGGMAEYRRPGGLLTSRRVGPPYSQFLRQRLLERRIEPAVIARVLAPVSDSVYVQNVRGEFESEDLGRRLLGLFVPLGFGFILAVSIFSAGSYLLQGLGEEKESRILESLLAIITPDELLVGKLLGLGSAALLLIVAWGGLGATTLATQAASFHLGPEVFLIGGLYFLVGYFFFGSIMLGIGSMVSTFQEANQFAAMISFSAMIPFFLLSVIIDEPNGAIATILSLFPWTAPVTMMMRLPSGIVPAWQIVVSLVVLAGCAALMMRGVARVFRIGLLLYGKTPNLPEIVRWARAK